MGDGRDDSLWWRDVHTLCREEWFSHNVSRVIGNGKNTMWLGEVSLRVRFPRLFDLSLFQDVSMFDLCQLGWGVEGQAWSWRRRLFAWEEKVVGELIFLLPSVSLQVDKTDT